MLYFDETHEWIIARLMFMEARMSSLAAQTIYTPEEYLALERKATLKSEYINGEILAMSGASNAHNLII